MDDEKKSNEIKKDKDLIHGKIEEGKSSSTSNRKKSNQQNDEIIDAETSSDINIDKKKNISIIKTKETNFSFDVQLSKILPVGLRNLGSTCFMNSCLQCFFHCASFTKELLLNNTYYEQINGEIISAFLKVAKNLYKNGKFPVDQKYKKFYDYSNNYYENETISTSAQEFYTYILNNFPRAYQNGSDPKMVAEIILLKMENELYPDLKYIPSINIPKTNEIQLFKDIYGFYQSLNKNIIISNFYWIKERECICSECNKSTYNFQFNYIHYFYPEKILKSQNYYKYRKINLSIEACFEHFKESDQDMTSFACKVCNKRVKLKSIINYMVTLPNYIVFCLFTDKNNLNTINYKFTYGKDIEMSYYFKDIKGNNTTCTKYKFQGGCYSTMNYKHSFAFSYHFDGFLYEFNDEYYRKVNSFEELYKEIPYLLIYRRADIDI